MTSHRDLRDRPARSRPLLIATRTMAPAIAMTARRDPHDGLRRSP